MIKRKLKEGIQILYRFWIWPFVRAAIEIRTKSILLPRSYISGTSLSGRNYIGKGTTLKNCRLGYGSYVNNQGDLTDVTIGKYTSIGTNVSTVIGKHPISGQTAMHPAFTRPEKIFGFSYVREQTFQDMPGTTVIGNDVWIGNHVLIMGGVTIGDGAVVGAGALVTKDLPPYSINVGVPAKTVKYRFSPEQIEKLLQMKWWNKSEEWIRRNISRFSDAEQLLSSTKEQE